jgi:hypothetical protein
MMESYFIDLDKIGVEIKWIQNFLKDIPSRMDKTSDNYLCPLR